MQAGAVYPNKKKIQIVDHPVPEVTKAKEAKLRIIDVGVCGTDEEIAKFKYGTPPGGSDYLIIGHEAVGQIVQTGSGVSNLKNGDFVVPMVRRPCQHKSCRACRSGHQDFCFTGDFFERGIKQAHGFLSESIVEMEEYLVFVPAILQDFAVLTEPLTICEKALSQVWNIQERLPWECRHQTGLKNGSCHNAVVLGSGPVGILGAMCLMDAGFQTYLYSRDPEASPKADIVKSIGANYISSEMLTVKQLVDSIGNIDLVYEATGASKLSFDVLKYMGNNGIFVFTGIPGRKHPIEMDTDLLMRNLVLKNLVVLGTVNAGKEDYENAVKHLEIFHRRWPDALGRLITDRYPLESFEDLVKGRMEGIKNVITFAASS